MRKASYAVMALCALMAALTPARSHPHVFVDVEMALDVGEDGVLRKIRYDWTFDDMYSAFAVQGLPKDAGAPTRAALVKLAEEIVEKLEDVDFFTNAAAQDHELQTTGAEAPAAALIDGRLRLSFTVMFRALKGGAEKVDLRVFDPQYVVAMNLKDGVRMIGPARCRHSLVRPVPLSAMDARQLDDSVRTNQLAANFGAKLASVVSVDCRTTRLP